MDGKEIATAWADYHRKVMPMAGPIQAKECRLAFYAGAIVVCTALMDTAGSKGQSKQDIDRIVAIMEELMAFMASSSRGKL